MGDWETHRESEWETKEMQVRDEYYHIVFLVVGWLIMAGFMFLLAPQILLLPLFGAGLMLMFAALYVVDERSGRSKKPRNR